MLKKSKLSLLIVGLSLLIAIFTLVLPTIYFEGNKTVIMGWITTFGGVIKDYNGSNINIGLSVGGLINFILPLVAGVLVYFFGKSQRSTYFIVSLIFIANIVLTLFTKTFFMNVNIGGSIIGAQSAVLSAGPYVCVSLSGIACIASLVGLFYKPNARLNKKY